MMNNYREVLQAVEHNLKVVKRELAAQLSRGVPDPRTLWGLANTLTQQAAATQQMGTRVLNEILDKVAEHSIGLEPAESGLPLTFNFDEIIAGLQADAEKKDVDDLMDRLDAQKQEEENEDD